MPRVFRLESPVWASLDSAGPEDGGRSSVGRAPDCGSGCRGFKSRRSPVLRSRFESEERPSKPLGEEGLERCSALRLELRTACGQSHTVSGSLRFALGACNAWSRLASALRLHSRIRIGPWPEIRRVFIWFEEPCCCSQLGKSPSTRSYRPWRLVFYCAFERRIEARRFESYLKTPSGKAFANKRFLPA